MQLEIQKYLFDIQLSIDSINEYLGNNFEAITIVEKSSRRIIKIKAGTQGIQLYSYEKEYRTGKRRC